MTQSLGSFLWAEAQEESGNRYLPWSGGNTAIGKYQVMPSNVGPWTQQALGYAMTPQQFADSPAAQEKVAQTILGGYYSKYGPAGAAAAWFSGTPDPNSNASDGNTTVRQYVANILSLMNQAPASASSGAMGSTTSDGVAYSGGATATDASSSTSTASAHPDALWGINLPVVGYTTILTKGQGRAITGALLLASAAVIGGAGVIILAAYGLKKSGAVDAAASAASVIPGAGGVAGKLATGARAVQGNAQPSGARKAASAKAAQQARNEERAAAREQRARNGERRRAAKEGELPS